MMRSPPSLFSVLLMYVTQSEGEDAKTYNLCVIFVIHKMMGCLEPYYYFFF